MGKNGKMQVSYEFYRDLVKNDVLKRNEDENGKKQAIKLNHEIPIIIDSRLKERGMGIYEGVSFEYLNWEKFWDYDSEL